MVSVTRCVYPVRDRVVTLHESELERLYNKIGELQKMIEKEGTEDNKSTDNNEAQHACDNDGKDNDSNKSSGGKSGVKDQEDNNIDKDPVIEKTSENTIKVKHEQPKEDQTSVVLEDNLFQTNRITDSSLYSFLDFEGEQDVVIHGNNLRYYYVDPTENNHILGVLSLPHKQYAIYLVEKVINFIGQEYYLFDAPKFLKEIEENYDVKLKTDNPTWMCYFCITLAVGEQYSNESLSVEVPGINYFNMAMKLFRSNVENPTFEYIQTLLLIAFYHQGLNRSNTAFFNYGLAIRSALIMGLHKKIKTLPAVEMEKRRRLWWTCYIMDSIWCAKLCQPIHVDSNDINIDINEIVKLDDNFQSDVLYYNSELAVIIGYVMKTMYNSTVRKTLADLLKCLKKLDDFQQNLLPKNYKDLILSGSGRRIANLYLRLNQTVIITLRPLVLLLFSGEQQIEIENTAEVNHAIKKCVSAACSNINILYHLRKIGMFSNFGFWDARYLFSSLLILYMTGDSYIELIKLGRELNKKMSDSGNFTAIENEIRFNELDSLFHKIRNGGDSDNKVATTPNQKLAKTPTNTVNNANISTSDGNGSTALVGISPGPPGPPGAPASISPNSLLLDDINNTFKQGFDSDEFMTLFQPLSTEMQSDIWKNLTTNLKSWDSTGY